MHAFIRKAIQWGMRLVVILPLVAAGSVAGSAAPVAAAGPTSGVVCTTSGSPNASFSLEADSGFIGMPDGNQIFVWSYSVTGGPFQFPGPVLCVNQGDSVTIVFKNNLHENASILFPGLDTVQANGVLAQPEGTGGALTSLTSSAAPTGTITYSFTASKPGTYLYESGTDSAKQVQMGLYGALIVRPRDSGGTLQPTWAYANGLNPIGAFNKDPNNNNEYLMLLSEIDPALHQAVELGQPYDVTALHPRYWLINGRAFPDTIAPNNAAWLPSQPYSALVHINVTDPTQVGGVHPPALFRYLDAGSKNHPFHPHGENGTVIARDATPLLSSTAQDLSYETFSFTIGSGQTWDQTYFYANQEQFDPNTNPIPVTVPQLQNLTFKGGATYYSGSPYLGQKGSLPVGTTSYNECGEYYMVMHSHALNEVANYDTGFGGMLTLERIDPLPGQQAVGTTCTP